MREFDCVILTGASGAVGSHFARQLVEHCPAPLTCLLRSPAALERMGKAVGPAAMSRLRPIFADLTNEHEVQAAAAAIGRGRKTLVVHCAGEVSWTKSERIVTPINVEGTRRMAELAVATSRERPTIVFLSTAFCSEHHPPRNPYEVTKLAAERALQADFAARADCIVLRCSLVVGAASDGRISRFNGLYPLIRILALAEVPCLIADADYAIDCVPVDFVWDQVARALQDQSPSGMMRLLVASAGSDALPIQKFVRIVLSRVDAFRETHGLPRLPEISILPDRQFRFLMRASKNWGLTKRFAKVEEISELMSGYIAHGGSGRKIEAITAEVAAPDPATYMGSVIDYWIEENAGRILTAREPVWLTADQDSVG